MVMPWALRVNTKPHSEFGAGLGLELSLATCETKPSEEPEGLLTNPFSWGGCGVSVSQM